ncbi:MAG: MTH1187 family thiamine-binding protein [Anaerolineales bacterium]
MKVIVDFSVIPIGVGLSLSPYVATCQRVLEQSGLHYELHPNGTDVEGEWDQVFAAIRRCHETLHELGVPRIATTIRVGTRTDRDRTMTDKVRSVQDKL